MRPASSPDPTCTRPGPLSVPAADPLNLTGIVLPGPRISALSGGLVELLPAAAPTAVGADASGTTAHTA